MKGRQMYTLPRQGSGESGSGYSVRSEDLRWGNIMHVRNEMYSIFHSENCFWRREKRNRSGSHPSMSNVCYLWPAPRYLFTVLLTVWMTKNDTVNLTCLSLILYNFLPEIIQSLLLSAACIWSSLTESNQSVSLSCTVSELGQAQVFGSFALCQNIMETWIINNNSVSQILSHCEAVRVNR